MDYEDLLIEADSNSLVVKEKPLRAYAGRIKGQRIAIKKDLLQTDKSCVLAEELGHYHTTVGDILDQTKAENRKQELRARLWAYNKMIGLNGIIEAYKHACSNRTEASEYLNVTEEFFQEAIECYGNKYGAYAVLDNYLILFHPLGVLELYK